MEGLATPCGLPVIGEEIAGKYRIDGVLGQGGMGAVFSAKNSLTGKRVAIKWLLPEQAGDTSRERLLREARIAASIEHPNVVDIYDIGEHDGGLFLVMEYLRGQTLGDLLAEHGRLDPVELIGLMIPVMRGVQFAHQGGIVHRDLKPENIIVSEVDGQRVPKVLDFGVSKSMNGAGIPHSTLTRTGALVGTPHYMALEQVDGTGAIDARTDVYALGVIFYRALTGHYPFDGTSLGEVILKIGTREPQPLRMLRPELTADLDAVILRAIARPRDARYNSVEDFARALEPFAPGVRFRESGETTQRLSAAAGGREPVAIPAGSETPADISQRGVLGMPASPTPLPRRRRTQAVMLGATLTLVAVVAGLAFWFQTGPGAPTRPVRFPPQPPVALRLAPEPSVREAVPAVGDTRPPAVGDTRPPAVGDTPSPAVAPGTLADPGSEPALLPGAVTATPSTPQAETTTLELAATAVAPPSNRRPSRPARPKGLKVVPGDRTKGLSADDF